MDEQQARSRHMLISLTRLSGAVLVILGMIALAGRIELDETLAWALIIAGAAGFFFVPLFLYRRWRTPKP